MSEEGTAAGGGGGFVECRLDSAHDLAALLAILQLREKEQKDQRVHCEASRRGLKFTAHGGGKDMAVLAWIFTKAFKEYRYVGEAEEMHLKLPVVPFLNCLQIFSDRASLTLRYPSGTSNELHFTLQEDGATTECRLRTLVVDEAPAPISSFFGPGDPLTVFRPIQPEAWHQALTEFVDLDAPDVALRIVVRAGGVTLRAQTLTSDAEVVLPHDSFAELEVAPEAHGEVAYRYLLTSVLASCLRASKDARGVKVRFNKEGIMSNQFILCGRPHDLFSESILCPMADGVGFAGTGGAGFADIMQDVGATAGSGSVAAGGSGARDGHASANLYSSMGTTMGHTFTGGAPGDSMGF